jgi:hypothetical protein
MGGIELSTCSSTGHPFVEEGKGTAGEKVVYLDRFIQPGCYVLSLLPSHRHAFSPTIAHMRFRTPPTLPDLKIQVSFFFTAFLFIFKALFSPTEVFDLRYRPGVHLLLSGRTLAWMTQLTQNERRGFFPLNEFYGERKLMNTPRFERYLNVEYDECG